jgi:hypothetical protein
MMRLTMMMALFVSVALVACGDDGDSPGGDGGTDAASDGAVQPQNALSGTITKTTDMTFHKVESFCYFLSGTLVNITVQYINKPTAASPTLVPLQLTVNAPVSIGQSIDLVKGGSLSRIMGDGKDLPELTAGSVTLSTGDCAGAGKVEGKLSATFKSGSTLQGEFSAKAEKVGN